MTWLTCGMLAEKKQLETELQKSIARNETVLKLYEKVYEDNAAGKVTDEFFMQLSHKYEVERMPANNHRVLVRRANCDRASGKAKDAEGAADTRLLLTL